LFRSSEELPAVVGHHLGLIVMARLVQESQNVPAVDAVEGVAVALGWLAPEADDLTVPQLPFVSLSHASRHRVLPARGVRVVLADLLPENLVDLGVGRNVAHHYGPAGRLRRHPPAGEHRGDHRVVSGDAPLPAQVEMVARVALDALDVALPDGRHGSDAPAVVTPGALRQQ